MTLGLRKDSLSNKKLLVIKEMINALKFCVIKIIRSIMKKFAFLEKYLQLHS